MPPFAVFLAGLATGAGLALLAPVLAPEATRNVRPVLRAGLKLAIAAGGALRVAAAEAVETLEDLYAEAEAELAAEAEAAAAEAVTEPPVAAAAPMRGRGGAKRGAKPRAARSA